MLPSAYECGIATDRPTAVWLSKIGLLIARPSGDFEPSPAQRPLQKGRCRAGGRGGGAGCLEDVRSRRPIASAGLFSTLPAPQWGETRERESDLHAKCSAPSVIRCIVAEPLVTSIRLTRFDEDIASTSLFCAYQVGTAPLLVFSRSLSTANLKTHH